MVTFSTKKKRITVGEHAVIDQEAIYACVIGLLVSERYLSFQEVLATELTAYPPSIFHADGQMRVAAIKSTLKKNVQVDVSQRFTMSPSQQLSCTSWCMCSVIWTLEWPIHGTVATFISGLKMWLSLQLSEADVYAGLELSGGYGG